MAVWPAADLERRVIRALDFAASAVSDFGETGYADAVRPALGFGPEKVVAEAAMLAYVAQGASVSRLCATASMVSPGSSTHWRGRRERSRTWR